jgi:hypothetical protein
MQDCVAAEPGRVKFTFLFYVLISVKTGKKHIKLVKLTHNI